MLAAIVAGAALGHFRPDAGRAMQPLSVVFINLVRMVVSPIIFLTIVSGIAGSGSLRSAGRVGVKALLYFEVVSTLALAVGLVVVNLMMPGVGLDPARLPHGDTASLIPPGHVTTPAELLTHVVPSSIIDAFARGDVLQIVFVAVLFGIATSALGETARPVITLVDTLSKVFFKIVAYVMLVAPIGAFGAMAFTIGTFGLDALRPLMHLMGAVYLTMAIFVVVVLGAIGRLVGLNIFTFLAFIRDEIVLVLGTSSSEAALPGLMNKLERFGLPPRIVRLVVPAGYSFNLDGTSIYLSMAVIFIAQVYHVHLTVGQQIGTLGLLMLTSKGAAGVTGSGFIVLASTLGATQVVPVEGVALLLGVDRFMSEARAIVNLIGNGVATVVIAGTERTLGAPHDRA